jgi:hypothetical protein
MVPHHSLVTGPGIWACPSPGKHLSEVSFLGTPSILNDKPSADLEQIWAWGSL